MREKTQKFISLVQELGFSPDDLLSALDGLPPFELWIQFGEAMAFFEGNDEHFSAREAEIIRELDRFILSLPPEPDPHWREDSLRNSLGRNPHSSPSSGRRAGRAEPFLME